MTASIALQLYSLREAMSHDLIGTLQKVAEMGYTGVETASFHNRTPREYARILRSLDFQVCGAHLPLPLGKEQAVTLKKMAALKCPRLIVPGLPHELFSTLDGLKQAAEMLQEASVVGAANGFTVGFHNHTLELQKIEGRPALLILAELVDPPIFFEIDTYWALVGGADPIAIIKQMGSKAPLLHIKDGPGVPHQPMTAVGDGTLDIPSIVAAGKEFTEWLVVELDECATDLVEAIAKSYDFLVGKGLARGNREI